MGISRKAEKLYYQLLRGIKKNGGVECEQYPEIYIAPDDTARTTYQQDYKFCRMICNRCPVKDLCKEYGVESHQEYGMWGGLAPLEIRKEFQRRYGHVAKSGRQRAHLADIVAGIEQGQAEEGWGESNLGPLHLSSSESPEWSSGATSEVLAWGEDWDSDAPLY